MVRTSSRTSGWDSSSSPLAVDRREGRTSDRSEGFGYSVSSFLDAREGVLMRMQVLA